MKNKWPTDMRSLKNLQQLDKLISAGRWPAGTRLPAERALALQLNCSRAALRETLQGLRARGLISSKTGAGSVVAAASPSALPALLQQSPRSRQELLAVRSALDALASEGAANLASNRELSAIRRQHKRFATAVEQRDLGSMTRYDTGLHLAIARASHNKVLLDIVAHLREALEASIAISSERLFAQRNFGRSVIAQHGEIIEAIARRDPLAARAAAIKHTNAIASRLQAL